jgi:hypothetical protein
MTRQAIYGGGWFDIDKARKFDEDTRWNGNNHISKATGSQWNHEALYVTKRGIYILNHWSQWQGSGESWTRIDAADAADWLTANGHEAPDAATASAQADAEV